jgi:hypothetical protein
VDFSGEGSTVLSACLLDLFQSTMFACHRAAERLRRIANRDGPFRSFDAASHRASASRTFQ